MKPAISDNPPTLSSRSIQLDAAPWSLANPWLVEGQANDRPPMDGSVTSRGGTAAARRAYARRCHQLNFKNGRRPGTINDDGVAQIKFLSRKRWVRGVRLPSRPLLGTYLAWTILRPKHT